jgi:predicted metal-dependent peptidase
MSDEIRHVLSTKQLEEFEFKVAKAMHLLLTTKPLYYYMLSKINRSIDANFQAPAAVTMDKKTYQLKLVLNPVKLAECTARDLKIVCEHEVLHLCFQHLFNMHRFTADVYNQAADYIINDNIEDLVRRYDELLGPTPSNALFSRICLAPVIKAQIPELKDVRIAEMDSISLYHILMKNKEKSPKRELMDDHSGTEGGPGTPGEAEGDEKKHNPSQSIPQSIVDQIMKDAAKEAQSHKEQGNIPASIQNRINELTKSNTNYRQVLQNFVCSLKQTEKERTWTRRNRKYPDQVRGRREVYRPVLVIVIDTSGSMTDERVRRAIAGEIEACSRVCGDLWVIVGDMYETFRLQIKQGKFVFENLAFTGGGGTDLQFGWDAAKKLNADGILCYTDGYIPSFESHGIKTLFCIYPQGKDIFGHKNIKMTV